VDIGIGCFSITREFLQATEVYAVKLG